MHDRENLDTPATSDYLDGVPESTLRYWRSIKSPDAPPSFKIGRRVYYRKSDLDAWLQKQYDSTVTGSRTA